MTPRQLASYSRQYIKYKEQTGGHKQKEEQVFIDQLSFM